MKYPVVLHKDPDSDYGVTIPDLPGCFSAGETMEEALENAKEAIFCHIEGLISDSEAIPLGSSIENYLHREEYKGGIWAIIQVDLSELSQKIKRINITMPERILSMLDKYAKQHGESRSGFLVTAAMEYIVHHK